VNELDLLILAAAVSAVIGGWRLGFLARVASWIGLALGLVVAARVLPAVLDSFQDADPTSRLLVVAGILIGGAFLGQALGLIVGAQFHYALPLGPIRLVDKALGGVAGIVGVLVALWAMLPSMADVPGWPARETRQSVIARAIDEYGPRPPDTLKALRRLVGEDQFPRVFADLAPSREVGPPPAASGISAEVDAVVQRATVKVTGVACRRIQEGSGFIVAPDVIVTNAHVVAGEQETDVITSTGRRLTGVVTVFDPDRDLAVVHVRGLDGTALPIGAGEVGDIGAVYGHPGGQDPIEVSPAEISQRVTAVGRDLYDSHETRRDVFILASELRPGDSGGPLVNPGGQVMGVAFAIAPDRPNTAYALTTDELRPVLAADGSAAANTGPCLANA
jgi:S1-C subfamily serine protease